MSTTTAPLTSLRTTPLLLKGELLINPEKVIVAKLNAELPKGTGVSILFDGIEGPTYLYDGDAQDAEAILIASSTEVTGV